MEQNILASKDSLFLGRASATPYITCRVGAMKSSQGPLLKVFAEESGQPRRRATLFGSTAFPVTDELPGRFSFRKPRRIRTEVGFVLSS